MKKVTLLFLLLVLATLVHAQTDSTDNSISLNTELAFATRNIWRGLDYGSSPSVQGTLSLSKDFFEVGAYGTTTLNGSKEGYGTWLELFGTAKYKQFSLTVDDYFFFNAGDSLNNYFDWGQSKTQHFIESRLKWDSDKLDIMAGYAFYKNKGDHTKGVYFEAEYSPYKNFSIILGGLTAANWLSFYDRGGITTIGVSGKRSLQITNTFSVQVKASLIFNPNYDGSVEAPGVGTNPVYFVAYFVL